MIIEILGFIVIVVVVLLAWSHFNPTSKVATTTKTAETTVQQTAIELSIAASNAANKATGEVVKLEIAAMRKWFSAAAQPHLDALDTENQTYLTTP